MSADLFTTFSRKQTISMSHSDTKTIGLQKSDTTLEVCYRRLDVLLDRLLCFCCTYEKDQLPLEALATWEPDRNCNECRYLFRWATTSRSLSVPRTTPKKTPTPSTKRTHLLDKVCLVIDLEGFCLGDQFLPRELGWFDWTGQHRGSIHYKPSMPWPDLSPKDRRTAYDCTTHIHGLAYYPQNLYHLAHELKTDAQHL